MSTQQTFCNSNGDPKPYVWETASGDQVKIAVGNPFGSPAGQLGGFSSGGISIMPSIGVPQFQPANIQPWFSQPDPLLLVEMELLKARVAELEELVKKLSPSKIELSGEPEVTSGRKLDL